MVNQQLILIVNVQADILLCAALQMKVVWIDFGFPVFIVVKLSVGFIFVGIEGADNGCRFQPAVAVLPYLIDIWVIFFFLVFIIYIKKVVIGTQFITAPSLEIVVLDTV